MSVSIGARPARAKAMSVSSEARPTRAKVTPVSRERFPMHTGHCGAWPSFNPTRRATHQRPGATVWRAPEGAEGQAATPAGYGGAWPRCRWAAAGPGRASRSTTPSRRLACGDLAGGPPPTGTHSGRAPQPGPPAPGTPAAPCCGDGGNRTPVPTRRPEHQGSNKQPSNARAPARHSKRGRHQPTPCASALTHP